MLVRARAYVSSVVESEDVVAATYDERIAPATAHRLNEHLQSIAACVALVRLAHSDPSRVERATSEILDKTREIGAIIRVLAAAPNPLAGDPPPDGR